MKYWVTLSFALFGALNAHSQVRFAAGPQVGLNVATAKYTGAEREFNAEPLTRGAAGGTASVGWQHWVAQASVLYAQKGFRLDDDYQDPGPGVRFTRITTKQTFRLNYLTLPLNVVFAQRANGQELQVFAGGYVSRLLGGSSTYNNSYVLQTNVGAQAYDRQGKTDIKAAGETADPDFNDPNPPLYSKPWDFGVQGGMGYQWGGLQVQLSYSRGLTDLFPPYVEDGGFKGPTYKLRTWQLSVAYLFGKRQ
ncbi:porin family protein [Hymenobacter sp. CRA2]|uniref:porin family protein n=1 Tax=Hymenobacter sp. CRA2 TaxID=1955620 RepID=UPI00098F4847|nr:porin family protein [Hymenobacter sp. CRA2]OON67242.1 hypothetical protein B0919_19135 [Hymenobacter sp. CRA2]